MLWCRSKAAVAGIAFFTLLIAHNSPRAEESSGQATPISMGHIVGAVPTARAVALCKKIDASLPSIYLWYDESSSGIGVTAERFKGQSRLRDIVCLYAGSTEVSSEISDMVKEGKLQALDTLPGFSTAINAQDIYSNLLEPVTIDGHVWAIPFRVNVPVIVVRPRDLMNAQFKTWDILDSAVPECTFVSLHTSDLFNVWLNMLTERQLALPPILPNDTMYSAYRTTFDRVRRLYKNVSLGDNTAQFSIASSDSFVDQPTLLRDALVFPLPGGSTTRAFCSSWTLFLGVSSSVYGPARKEVSQVLAAFLSAEVQLELARGTYSPPVSRSVATSVAFREICANQPQLAVLNSMTPRLSFSKTSQIGHDELQSMESSFAAALENPALLPDVLSPSAIESASGPNVPTDARH